MNGNGKSRPLVTAVIGTYNQGHFLAEAIESVLAQTYPAVELIVVDDGSTDDTPQVAARYGTHIRYIRQANGERAAARNHGLRLANGEFTGFLDSDDAWLPWKVEEEVAVLLENPATGLVYCDVELVDPQGRLLGREPRESHNGWVTEALLRNNFVVLSANLGRTEVIREVGGFREDRRLSGSEDWELWMRLSTACQFAYLHRTVTRYRVHPGATTANPANLERSMAAAVDYIAQWERLTPAQQRLLPRARAKSDLVNAMNYRVAGRTREAWKFLARAAMESGTVLFDHRFGGILARLLTPQPLMEYLRRRT